MTIEYWPVLGRSWRRMKALLFRPFEPGKWLILAFCAWVATLLDGWSGGGPRGGARWRGGGQRDGVDLEQVLEGLRQGWTRLQDAWHWLLGNWGASLVVFVGIPIVLALILGLVWITSRFQMVYLDNLVRGRAEVSEPWRRLRRLGDSLFLFRISFGLAAFAAGAALVALLVTFGVLSFSAAGRGVSIAGLVVSGMVLLFYMVAVAYVSLFLRAFVIPIMYRDDLPAMAAWRVFLPWLSSDPASFLLYGLFVLLLFVGAGAAIAVFGFATCCLGFAVLAIPYLGTLVLLPLLVTYRYLSLEFLAQFGPNLDVFAARAAGPSPGVPA